MGEDKADFLPRKLSSSARLRGGATVEARHPGRTSRGEFPTSISAGQKVAHRCSHYRLSSRMTMGCVLLLFGFILFYLFIIIIFFVAKQKETVSGVEEVKSPPRILWS